MSRSPPASPVSARATSVPVFHAGEDLRRARPGLTLLKAIHVNQAEPLAEALRYAALLDGFVADSCNPSTGQVGGTGLVHDWSLSARLVEELPKPLLLAGGLTPANVIEAIERVQPWGVDVNSGVTAKDGWEGAALMERFIQQAQRAGASR